MNKTDKALTMLLLAQTMLNGYTKEVFNDIDNSRTVAKPTTVKCINCKKHIPILDCLKVETYNVCVDCFEGLKKQFTELQYNPYVKHKQITPPPKKQTIIRYKKGRIIKKEVLK